MKLIKYFLIAIIFTINFSVIALTAKAVDSDASTPPLNFTPEVSIPSSTFNNTVPTAVGSKITTVTGNVTTVTMRSDLIGKYIQALYNYGLAIVSILATIVLMGGGLIWLTSGGDSSKITKAKEMIFGSLTGMVILFCAWIILNTVNPALLELKPIDTIIISKIVLGCCEQAKDDRTIKMTTSDNCTGNFYENRTLNNGKCEALVCCKIVDSQLKYTRCFNSFPQTCAERISYEEKSSYGGTTGSVTENSCSVIPECQIKGNTFSCDGIRDGDAPKGDNTFRCYNGIIYSGDNGNLGEPCGIKSNGYGFCVKYETPCNDRNNLGLGGGRNCGDGLKCCLD